MPKGKRHAPSATLDEPDDKEIGDLALPAERVHPGMDALIALSDSLLERRFALLLLFLLGGENGAKNVGSPNENCISFQFLLREESLNRKN
jgi:hypothetical protein